MYRKEHRPRRIEKVRWTGEKAGGDGVNGRRIVNLLEAFIVFFCKKNYSN